MLDGDEQNPLSGPELALAEKVLKSLPNPVFPKVIQTNNSSSFQFRRFIEDLSSISDNLRPLYVSESEDGPPVIEIQANLRYLVLPNGRELEPFLQALKTKSGGEIALTARSVSTLRTFITPTLVEVFVSPVCPNCPVMVGLACQLALASSYLDVSIIDATLLPSYAEKYDIQAVPTVVVDGQDRLVGIVSEEILVDRLSKQDPSAFHPDSFRRIIKEGDAEKLASMMVEEGRVYSKALELLADHDWSVRLGMMVVLEEVAERRPDLACLAYPCLLELLDHEDGNRRGDGAYLLGQIGDLSVLSKLELLEEDEDPEVAEASRESIQQIRDRWK